MPRIDKPKIRAVIAPGKASFGEIIVENPTPLARTMRLYLEDWRYTPAGDGSKEFVPPGTTPFSCSSWITFSPSEFTVPPFGKQRVSYSISAPDKAAGAYYSVLFFENAANEDTIEEGKIGAGISVAVRVASLIYVDIKDTVTRKADIGALSGRKTEEGYAFDIAFHNTGNGDIAAGGSYHIMDRQDLIVARGELIPGYTMGGESAKMHVLWKDTIPPGDYIFVATIDLGLGLKDTGSGRGQVLVKEAALTVGSDGEITGIGEFK
jgi:hypothetical protein